LTGLINGYIKSLIPLFTSITIAFIWTMIINNILEANGQITTAVTNVNASTNNLTQFLTYTDQDLGFQIDYPADWTKQTDQSSGNYVALFFPPNEQNVGLSVKFNELNREDLNDIASQLKKDKTYRITSFYQNDSTTLSGLPAVKAIGIKFFEPGMTEKALGELGTSNKMMVIGTVSKNNQEFYRIEYQADKPTFEQYRPIVEQMIDSFRIITR
jgi:PsbP